MKQAVVAVIRQGERVLVIERGPAARRSGHWGPPSGTIEPGETQAETVVREVKEEVGLVVRAVRKVWECPTDEGSYRLHWWLVEVRGGEVTPDGREVTDARWVRADEFLTMDGTFAGDREFFREVLPGL